MINPKEKLVSPINTPGIVPTLDELVVTTTVSNFKESYQRWVQNGFYGPFSIGSGCCSSEYWQDKETQRITEFREDEIVQFQPDSSNLLIVAGVISEKMIPFIKDVYNKMPEQKWVMAVGACSSTGGPFHSYSVIRGISDIIPVDVYVPGCPPSIKTFELGIQQISERVALGVCSANGTSTLEVRQ